MAVLLTSTFLLCAPLLIFAKKPNNACFNFNDYNSIMNSNRNCFYYEDATLKSSEIISKYAPEFSETHQIISEDGYISTLFRIAQNQPKGIILLHHSIATDSRLFLWNGNESFAFNLWKEGYDVWLANHRGTTFSNKHRTLTKSQFEYWNFSFHEIAKFDVPAEINYIRSRTANNLKITFVGHSLGATVGLVYSTLFPEQTREFLNGFILVAPPCFFKGSVFGFKLLLPVYRLLQNFLESTRIVGDAVSFLPLLEKYGKTFIENVPATIPVVVEIVLLICGQTHKQANPLFFNYDSLINLNDFSFKILYHYAQWLPTDANFMMYSYESAEKNLEIYGSKQAPNYRLEDINVPVMLISGLDDALITSNNSNLLYSRLKANNVSNVINVVLDGYNHLDFFAGKFTSSFVEAFYSLLAKL